MTSCFSHSSIGRQSTRFCATCRSDPILGSYNGGAGCGDPFVSLLDPRGYFIAHLLQRVFQLVAFPARRAEHHPLDAEILVAPDRIEAGRAVGRDLDLVRIASGLGAFVLEHRQDSLELAEVCSSEVWNDAGGTG